VVRRRTALLTLETVTTTEPAPTPDDLAASDVAWNLDTLVADTSVDALLAEASERVATLEGFRGRIAELDAAGLAELMGEVAALDDVLGRAGSYAGLRLAADTLDAEAGALVARVGEVAAQLGSRTVFLELEWAEVPDDRVEELLADERLAFCAHHLRNLRRYRPHLLAEPEERVLSEKSPTGASAWVRLFDELTSSIEVDLDVPLAQAAGLGDEPAVVGLEQGLALLAHPDRDVRRGAAEAVTVGLAPGLRTRAYVFNTLLADKAIDDRLRAYPTWLSARNLANEASDSSVAALIEAVTARYDLPQRWYRLKASVLGIDRLADYDRMASLATSERLVGWAEARDTVLGAYRSFSPVLADAATRFFDERWIDAPVRPNKRPGAFCAYTVPSHHPYVLLNWTGRTRDVATLAHELGHGLHAWLARDQGVFHQSTPLTLAETASVFGETVTTNALLAAIDDPDERLALLASSLEDSIATVFRQVAMNRFEDAVHTERRDVGEVSVDRLGELWVASQAEMLGDSVEITEGYRTWWSYIPHFIGSPGYVYAYAYGQLLALSVYARYLERGADFVDDYLTLLAAGGSMDPVALGRIVDCDLEDPSFWDAGLDIVAGQLDAAADAARAAGRLG
jgi:oligoendopeptidase F